MRAASCIAKGARGFSSCSNPARQGTRLILTSASLNPVRPQLTPRSLCQSCSARTTATPHAAPLADFHPGRGKRLSHYIARGTKTAHLHVMILVSPADLARHRHDGELAVGDCHLRLRRGRVAHMGVCDGGSIRYSTDLRTDGHRHRPTDTN